METKANSPYDAIKRHLEEVRYEGVDRLQKVVRGSGFDVGIEIIYSILRNMEGAGEIRRTGDVVEWIGT